MEEETENQEAEVNNDVEALELYRPGSQMLESAPDTHYESHLKSGKVDSRRILIFTTSGTAADF